MWNKIKAVCLTACAVVIVPSLAMAEGTGDMDQLFNAVDISSVSTNVTTILVALIGVFLIFLGYKFVRKAIK